MTMQRHLTTALFAMILLTGSLLGAQVSFGIQIGPPPAPRVERVRPVQPGPGYAWVDGYWYPVNNHWKWHKGYWTRAPYPGATWLGPRYEGGHYYEGYWQGEHGQVRHEHQSDKHRERDYYQHDRNHDYDHDHDHR